MSNCLKYIAIADQNGRRLLYLAILLIASQLQGQVLDNNFLTGLYGFRQVLISTNPAGQPIEMRSMVGVFSFDGRGNFSYKGMRNLNNNAPNAVSGAGIYSVSASGFVALANPLDANSTMNLRLGGGLLLGSTTDSSGNLFDLLVAVPLSPVTTSNATLTGAYAGTSIEFPNSLFFNVKNSFMRFSSNGVGGLGTVSASGQTVQSGKRVLLQSIVPGTYSISSDSSGLMIFPPTGPYTTTNQLLLGDKQIYISAGGDYVIGGSISQGAHDLVFAMRTLPGVATAKNFNGLYYGAGLKVEQSRPTSFSGAVNALGNGKAVWSRRVRQPEGNTDSTAINDYTINPDGVGSILTNRFAIGVNNNLFLSCGTSFVDSDNYEVIIGVKTRDLSGTSPFLNPAGVLNGASFAPVGNPIAPGQFMALFGTGLGPTTPVVASAPFPATLGGVSVSVQGRPAPLYFVSAGQISALVPFATSGTSAEVVVKVGSVESNRVVLPVSRTSPGIYSNSQNGIGSGAILKADFSIVTVSNPARRGDTVLVYLTGLGALETALADGAASSSTVLNKITDSVNVYIGGIKSTVTFAGAAPGFAGLYQINVQIPAAAPIGSAVPLAIETSSSFHDMVDIAISPTP